jgi:elongator complex protein 3
MQDTTYAAGGAEEHFLSFVTPDDRLAGYLRLSLPGPGSPPIALADLEQAALVRDLHVYGQSLPLGESTRGAAQHSGLGTRLMQQAEDIARKRGFRRLTVIAALGTRGYYRNLGFGLGETYMIKDLD